MELFLNATTSYYFVKLAFIFAHPDDESLSSGGTIAKYASSGHHVSTLCLSSDEVRKKEYLKATEVLGVQDVEIYDFNNVENHVIAIKEKVIQYILKTKPETIITHIENDYHIDHRLTHSIIREGIEWAAHETQHENPHLVSKLYTTETTILIPNPHILVDISDFQDKKVEAIKCYESQLYKGGEDFYLTFHNHRTLMRGAQASTRYAEAYLQIPLKKNSPFYKQKHSEL